MTQTMIYRKNEEAFLVEYDGVSPWEYAEISRVLLEELARDAGWIATPQA